MEVLGVKEQRTAIRVDRSFFSSHFDYAIPYSANGVYGRD
jgi:hypothetical protein